MVSGIQGFGMGVGLSILGLRIVVLIRSAPKSGGFQKALWMGLGFWV